MSDPPETDALFHELIRGRYADTSALTELSLIPIPVDILEMEDVLFHLASAVMMPDNPRGRRTDEGGQATTEQEAVSGVRALALIYREMEIDPRKRILIAGHTDTSGQPRDNFELSEQRAQNVLFLLQGDQNDWASLSYQQHRIDDYQQIMEYYSVMKGWDCDPQGIDNYWGDHTRQASINFFAAYNRDFAPHRNLPLLPDGLIHAVERDGKKRWPVEAWQAVFNLYMDDIRSALNATEERMQELRGLLLYVDDSNPYIACGESFPIDQAEQNNYKSQANRRVEILLFDQDEIPTINCPPARNTVHTAEECPIWNRLHYYPVYMDRRDLTAVPYHLKFVYFDRIRNEWKPVPDGLSIRAFGDGDSELTARNTYRDGIYTLRLRDDPARTSLYFTFETTDLWIYTESDTADPTIVTRTAEQMAALSFVDRLKYFDLPRQWSSRNYWTRYDNNMANGGRFEEVMRTTKTLKPYGSNITSPGAPLMFSLNDIVLAGAGNTQNLQDKNPIGGNIPLDANSRYTLFCIDHDTNEDVGGTQRNMRRMKIHNPDSNEPVFTTGALQTNLICDVSGHARMVLFAGAFYDIFEKRSLSSDTGFDLTRNHVLGARLAVLEDTSLQAKKLVRESTADDITKGYAADNCGNYELHYFDKCDELDGKMLGYLFIYWSCRFEARDVRGPNPTTGADEVRIQAGGAGDITNHRQSGAPNANARLNKKYLIEKESGDCDIIIRPYYFIEAKNDTNGGPHKALVNIVKNFDVDGNDSGAWMRPEETQLRCRDYQDDPNYLANPDPDNNVQDTDGQTYCILTNHHEFGHATGNWDEYLYNYEDGEGNWSGLPMYDQPFTAEGGPYSCDKLSRMYHNRTPRLRNFWKYVCWLHDASVTGGVLNPFFRNTRFKMTHRATSFIHNFSLDEAYRVVNTPGKVGRNHAMAADIRADLLLYKLGDDELSHMIAAGQTFNGILAIKTKFALKFINGAGTDVWNFPTKRTYARRLNSELQTMLNDKFKISTPNDNAFKNIFVHFVPHFKVYTGGAPGDSHFNIEVTFTVGSAFATSGEDIEVQWGEAADNGQALRQRIIRYCFGKTTGTGNLTSGDFGTIVDWIKNQCGDTGFVMSNI